MIEAPQTIGTIRVTVNTVGATLVFDGQCRVCNAVYGPDSEGNIRDWLKAHLWERHKLVIVGEATPKLGQEQWDERFRPVAGAEPTEGQITVAR